MEWGSEVAYLRGGRGAGNRRGQPAVELEGPDAQTRQQDDKRYDKYDCEQFYGIHFNHIRSLLIEFELCFIVV